MSKPAHQDLSNVPAENADHDAWARQRIENTLKAKAEGRLTYTPLSEIAAKYGFDAR